MSQRIGAPDAIGVTGLPCAGKSFAAACIAGGDFDGKKRTLLKADDIGHALLTRLDVLFALREHFGAAVVDAFDPAATRRVIAEKVFAEPAELEWLEGLIHPLVTEEVLRLAAEADGGAVIESALLFAPGAAEMKKQCGAVIVVEADAAARLKRAAMRGWDENELRRRESRLLPLFAAGELQHETNLVRVDNSGSLGAFRAALCAALLRRKPAF